MLAAKATSCQNRTLASGVGLTRRESPAMNWAFIHLALNHIPVILMPTALVMLAFVTARRRTDLRDVTLVLVIVAGIFGAGAYLTGEPAEEVVENLPDVSADAIEQHEEAGLTAAVATGLAGLLALGTLLAGHRREGPPWMPAATLVVTLVASILLARTAHLGGQISHPEIRRTVQ